MSKKTPEQARINSHQTMSPERIKAMKESLRVAAKIRRELTGRAHSDSTHLADCVSDADRELLKCVISDRIRNEA
jgi:hypothetical protein